jgi:hypothetical protein
MIMLSARIAFAFLAISFASAHAGEFTTSSKAARGPLRVHPNNPRYFTDGTKIPGGTLNVVYLAGSHHWNNLQDSGKIDGPLTKTFDDDRYLDLLSRSNHNFIRLWAWESAGYWWQGRVNDEYYEPLPYRRTGPGKGVDDKPKFDLDQFNPEYFERLRSRVVAARDKGMYVSIMLFQGWSIYSHGYGNPWPRHPFNEANNVNGVHGDIDRDGEGKEVHSLEVPEITRLQEAYVRKVIDTVNDLDNVLYEVTNETANHSKDWQYHLIRYVKEYESKKAKQHPVGMTYFDSGPRGTMDALLHSPADWISPGDDGGQLDYAGNPPAADGRKVSIADTDHIYGMGGDGVWVWKAFMRGHNPIYMDPLKEVDGVRLSEAEMEGARRAMGDTRRYAERMNLAAMTPQLTLVSTQFCLAEPGKQYLVYLPEGGTVTVDLSPAKGQLCVEWFDPVRREQTGAEPALGCEQREFRAPFDGAAVLYLKADATKD